jgi:hypothetical protein
MGGMAVGALRMALLALIAVVAPLAVSTAVALGGMSGWPLDGRRLEALERLGRLGESGR